MMLAVMIFEGLGGHVRLERRLIERERGKFEGHYFAPAQARESRRP
jgi:broad specificity phosphatase PhoE